MLTLDQVAIQIPGPESRSDLVGFTNGCFDLIHAGHVHFLESCRRLVGSLIVGINSDESVRAIKGNGRPICGQNHRLDVVMGLRAVDFAFIFDDRNVVSCLRRLRPDVWFKGSDYTLGTLDPAELLAARQVGAEIAMIASKANLSTTGIIEQVIQKIAGPANGEVVG